MPAPAVSPGNRGRADPERRAAPGPSTGSGAAARPFQPAGKPHHSSELPADADAFPPIRAVPGPRVAPRRACRRADCATAQPHTPSGVAPLPGQRRTGAVGATCRARVPVSERAAMGRKRDYQERIGPPARPPASIPAGHRPHPSLCGYLCLCPLRYFRAVLTSRPAGVRRHRGRHAHLPPHCGVPHLSSRKPSWSHCCAQRQSTATRTT